VTHEKNDEMLKLRVSHPVTRAHRSYCFVYLEREERGALCNLYSGQGSQLTIFFEKKDIKKQGKLIVRLIKFFGENEFVGCVNSRELFNMDKIMPNISCLDPKISPKKVNIQK